MGLKEYRPDRKMIRVLMNNPIMWLIFENSLQNFKSFLSDLIYLRTGILLVAFLLFSVAASFLVAFSFIYFYLVFMGEVVVQL